MTDLNYYHRHHHHRRRPRRRRRHHHIHFLNGIFNGYELEAKQEVSI